MIRTRLVPVAILVFALPLPGRCDDWGIPGLFDPFQMTTSTWERFGPSTRREWTLSMVDGERALDWSLVARSFDGKRRAPIEGRLRLGGPPPCDRYSIVDATSRRSPREWARLIGDEPLSVESTVDYYRDALDPKRFEGLLVELRRRSIQDVPYTGPRFISRCEDEALRCLDRTMPTELQEACRQGTLTLEACMRHERTRHARWEEARQARERVEACVGFVSIFRDRVLVSDVEGEPWGTVEAAGQAGREWGPTIGLTLPAIAADVVLLPFKLLIWGAFGIAAASA